MSISFVRRSAHRPVLAEESGMRRPCTVRALSLFLLLLALLPIASALRPVIFVITNDDLSPDSVPPDDSPVWDEFGDPGSASASDDDHDPGSWRPVLESSSSSNSSSSSSSDDPSEALYLSAVRAMISAASSGDPDAMDSAASDIEAAASSGHPHAQSALACLIGAGIARPQSRPKSYLYHQFAAEGGDRQSKMVLAYTYFRQNMYDKAVKLYAELAETAVSNFFISTDQPVLETVRIHSGTEENKEALKESRGEDDDDFQILEYQAHKGNAAAMYRMGLLYYYGLRGVRRDHAKAFYWFSKAVEKGENRVMELLGEMYARGTGVERNYTKAFEWLTLASRHQQYSAYNGLGYLYVKGYGVAKRNLTKVSSSESGCYLFSFWIQIASCKSIA